MRDTTSDSTVALVPITKIVLARAEGPTFECVTRTFESGDIMLSAISQLMRWSRSAPPAGQGYDKVDVSITWADGVTYAMRYDMQRDLVDQRGRPNTLSDDLRNAADFYAGRRPLPEERSESSRRYLAHLRETQPDFIAFQESLGTIRQI